MNSTMTLPTPQASDRASRTAATAPALPLLDLLGIASLGAVIAIHTSELSGKTEETAYLGFGYVLLIAASLVAIVLIAQRDLRGWILAGLTAASTMVGFVLTRTVGLPNATGDIGNWGEVIAIWSMLAEAIVLTLALVALRRRTV